MSGLEEDLKVKAVEVEEKKAQAEAMIPRLEAEKSTADGESRAANKVADEAAKKEAEVIRLKERT